MVPARVPDQSLYDPCYAFREAEVKMAYIDIGGVKAGSNLALENNIGNFDYCS